MKRCSYFLNCMVEEQVSHSLQESWLLCHPSDCHLSLACS